MLSPFGGNSGLEFVILNLRHCRVNLPGNVLLLAAVLFTLSMSGAYGCGGTIPKPVVERMLEVLGHDKLPPGLDAEEFTRKFFQNFSARKPSCFTDTLNQGRETSAEILKERKCDLVESSLGLMGFQATSVFKTMSVFLVGILTSLLGATVTYDGRSSQNANLPSTKEPWKFFGEKKLCPNGVLEKRISITDVHQIVESCLRFLSAVNGNETESLAVAEALLKVTAESNAFTKYRTTSEIYISDHGKTGFASASQGWAVQKLLDLVLEKRDTVYSKLRPQSRLRFWRIRPLCLKEDLSSLAHKALMRPLLQLKMNLQQFDDWSILILSLALAPDVFSESCRLLHSWFLSTGAVRLWEVRAELAASLRNVLFHPSSYGFVAEVNLPPHYSFYGRSLRPFLRLLNEPPRQGGLVELVQKLDNMKCSQPGADASSAQQFSNWPMDQRPSRPKLHPADEIIDWEHTSVWALLMDYRPWLNFAMRQLFLMNGKDEDATGVEEDVSGESGLDNKGIRKSSSALTASNCSYSKTAAKYIAWILCPLDAVSRQSREKILLCIGQDWERVVKLMKKEKASETQNSQASKLASCMAQTCLCKLCGVPLRISKKPKIDGLCRKDVNIRLSLLGDESIQALASWLDNLHIQFGDPLQRAGSERFLGSPRKVKGKGALFSEASNSTTSTRKYGKQHFLVESLPIAALAATAIHCSEDTFKRLVLFVVHGRDIFVTAREHQLKSSDVSWLGRSTCIRCDSLAHCDTCCPNGNCKPVHEDSGSLLDYSCRSSECAIGCIGDVQSLSWVSHAASIFNFLDILDDEQIDKISCENMSDFRRGLDNFQKSFSMVFADCLLVWIKSSESLLSDGILKGLVKEKYLTALEDLQTRFSIWIEKVQLPPELSRRSANAIDGLDARIALLRTQETALN